jgi:plasmid stabilization system protein ParE
VKLRFTERAVRQIEEIVDAIARESPQGARRVRERMQNLGGPTCIPPRRCHIYRSKIVAAGRQSAAANEGA